MQMTKPGGRVTAYAAPGGPGIRVESALYAGYDPPTAYDPLLLKVIARGPAGADGTPPPPLATWQAMLCGGVAGAVSAVATQPIDTGTTRRQHWRGHTQHSNPTCELEQSRRT